MGKYIELAKKNLINSIEAKQELLASKPQLAMFERAVGLIVTAYQNGGRLYIAGNGGSAADAQHLAAEFVSKLARPRAPLAAEALTVDSSILTAIGNDYGYDEVFARQIEGKMTEKDVFLGITTSGMSKNIVRALEQCREQGIKSIVLAGNEGGVARALCDICIIAPGQYTSTIQEVHTVMYHTLCEAVESALLFPEIQPARSTQSIDTLNV